MVWAMIQSLWRSQISFWITCATSCIREMISDFYTGKQIMIRVNLICWRPAMQQSTWTKNLNCFSELIHQTIYGTKNPGSKDINWQKERKLIMFEVFALHLNSYFRPPPPATHTNFTLPSLSPRSWCSTSNWFSSFLSLCPLSFFTVLVFSADLWWVGYLCKMLPLPQL